MRFWCVGVLVLDDAVKMEDPSTPHITHGKTGESYQKKTWDGAEEGIEIKMMVCGDRGGVTLRWKSDFVGVRAHLRVRERGGPN